MFDNQHKLRDSSIKNRHLSLVFGLWSWGFVARCATKICKTNPISPNVQMNLSLCFTMNYELRTMNYSGKNKPNLCLRYRTQCALSAVGGFIVSLSNLFQRRKNAGRVDGAEKTKVGAVCEPSLPAQRFRCNHLLIFPGGLFRCQGGDYGLVVLLQCRAFWPAFLACETQGSLKLFVPIFWRNLWLIQVIDCKGPSTLAIVCVAPAKGLVQRPASTLPIARVQVLQAVRVNCVCLLKRANLLV